MSLPGRVIGGAVAVGVAAALLVPGTWRDAAGDRLTPTASHVDDRVVVVSFDERAAENSAALSIPQRRGVYLRDLAVQAERGGAAALVFVGFDSLALREGPADRQAIGEAARIKELGIAPLLEVDLGEGADGVPVALRYRVDELAGAFAGIGLPVVADQSGVLRRVPAVATVPVLEPGALIREGEAQGRAGTPVYGLAVRSLLAVADGARGPAAGSEILVAGRTIPLEDGWLRVRWSHGLDDASDVAVVPFGRILSGGGPRASLAGKVLVVGTTDPAQTPFYDTPLGPMPEVLVHANALNTVLTEQYLRPTPGWIGLAVALIVAIAIGLLWWWRWWLATLAGLGIAFGWLALTRVLAGDGRLVEPLRPVVAALVTLAILGLVAQTRHLLQRRRLTRLFSEYVPPDVARDLIESGRAEVAQAGERLMVTVLFCDLRGFTPTAARLAPADVRELLDTYYEAFSPLVFKLGGTVIQYTGDEILAVFGAPVPRSDHADAALQCARAMVEKLPALNAQLASRQLPAVAFGIGLHSGEVVAAHIGSSIRRQYSVIGDTVNVGSRLCSQAREGQIVYSQAVLDHLLGEPDAEALGEVELKGVEQPMSIYRLRIEPTSELV